MGAFLYIGIIALVILSIVAWIWAIIDIAKAENDSDWKLIWILVVVLVGIIGVIIYYFAGRPKRIVHGEHAPAADEDKSGRGPDPARRCDNQGGDGP